MNTLPQPSPSVEAAVQRLMQYADQFALYYPEKKGWSAQAQKTDRANFEAALRAELASPPVAPVGDADELTEAESVSACLGDDAHALRIESPQNEEIADNMERAAELLDQYRAATRHQEVVRAEPDKQTTEFCRAWEGPRSVPSDAEIIERCEAAGVLWCKPDGEEGGFPGSFDMCTMAEMRKLLYTAPAGTVPLLAVADSSLVQGVEAAADTVSVLRSDALYAMGFLYSHERIGETLKVWSRFGRALDDQPSPHAEQQAKNIAAEAQPRIPRTTHG